MTATSSGRTGGEEQQKARARRGLGNPMGRGPTASDREGRSAAAAARGVRVLEGEPRLLEVALVVQGDAVQVLGAEGVDKAPHAGRIDDDVVLGRLVFDVHAVLESRAPARKHRDPESGALGRDIFLRHELPHLGRCRLGHGEGDGTRVLRRGHCDPPVTCELRQFLRASQLSGREAAATMRLTFADWSVVALYFLFNLGVGLYYKSRASRSTAEFTTDASQAGDVTVNVDIERVRSLSVSLNSTGATFDGRFLNDTVQVTNGGNDREVVQVVLANADELAAVGWSASLGRVGEPLAGTTLTNVTVEANRSVPLRLRAQASVGSR